MRFDILDNEAHLINDPDSGETIGQVNRPKVRVKVVLVESKFSIARTYIEREENIGGYGGLDFAQTRLFEKPKWIKRVETLRTTEDTWENLSEEESFVETGDCVVQVPNLQK